MSRIDLEETKKFKRGCHAHILRMSTRTVFLSLFPESSVNSTEDMARAVTAKYVSQLAGRTDCFRWQWGISHLDAY
jgi:hypothetical protein